MNTKLAVTLILLGILSIGFASQIFAQTRVAGVQQNDYFTYSVTSHWTSENATEPIPSCLIDYNNTKEYKVLIGGVTGVNVTSTQTWDFKNGTQFPYLIVVDIESGDPYYMSGNYPPPEGVECIVGANLNAGNLLHPAGNDSITINQTITRNYANEDRQTNVIQLNGPIQNETIDEATNSSVYVTIGNQDVTYNIDKATGVLVKKTTTIESISPNETLRIDWTLEKTNLWNASPPVNSFLYVEVALIVVIIVAVVILVFRYTRRGRKHRR
jgi:hypothetical protein